MATAEEIEAAELKADEDRLDREDARKDLRQLRRDARAHGVTDTDIGTP